MTLRTPDQSSDARRARRRIALAASAAGGVVVVALVAWLWWSFRAPVGPSVDESVQAAPHDDTVREDPLKDVEVPPLDAVTVSSPRATLGWFGDPTSGSASAPAAAGAATPASAQKGAASSIAESDEASAANDTLLKYRRAYNARDVEGIRGLWPSADAEYLRRSFDPSGSQRLNFDRCEINVTGSRATGVCRVSFGSQADADNTPAAPREWVFQMRKLNQAWTISSLDIR